MLCNDDDIDNINFKVIILNGSSFVEYQELQKVLKQWESNN